MPDKQTKRFEEEYKKALNLLADAPVAKEILLRAKSGIDSKSLEKRETILGTKISALLERYEGAVDYKYDPPLGPGAAVHEELANLISALKTADTTVCVRTALGNFSKPVRDDDAKRLLIENQGHRYLRLEVKPDVPDEKYKRDYKDDAAAGRVAMHRRAAAIKQQQRLRAVQERAAAQKKAEHDANIVAAKAFRRYLEKALEHIADDESVREEVSMFRSFFDRVANPIFKSAREHLQVSRSSVRVPQGVKRKVVSAADVASSQTINAAIENNLLVEAKHAIAENLQMGEAGINFVEEKEATDSKKLGCYIEHQAVSGYQIAVHQYPAGVNRAKMLEEVINIKTALKDYKEHPPTHAGLAETLRTYQGNMPEEQYHQQIDAVLQAIRSKLVQQIPAQGMEVYIPNQHYLDFANKIIDSYLAAVGTKKTMYIYPQSDPTLVAALVLICEARKIPYEDSSRFGYQPQTIEIEYVREQFKKGDLAKTKAVNVNVDAELRELQQLKNKVRNVAVVEELEQLVRKIGSGVSLSDKEKERVNNLLHTTHDAPQLKH